MSRYAHTSGKDNCIVPIIFLIQINAHKRGVYESSLGDKFKWPNVSEMSKAIVKSLEWAQHKKFQDAAGAYRIGNKAGVPPDASEFKLRLMVQTRRNFWSSRRSGD